MYLGIIPILILFCLPQIGHSSNTSCCSEILVIIHFSNIEEWKVKAFICPMFSSNTSCCNEILAIIHFSNIEEWKVKAFFCPMFCDLWEHIAFSEGSQALPFICLGKNTYMKMRMDYCWNNDRKNQNTWRKMCPSATVQRHKTKINLHYVHTCYSFIPWRVLQCSIYEFMVNNFTITFFWQDGLCSSFIPHIRMGILTHTSKSRTNVFHI